MPTLLKIKDVYGYIYYVNPEHIVKIEKNGDCDLDSTEQCWDIMFLYRSSISITNKQLTAILDSWIPVLNAVVD